MDAVSFGHPACPCKVLGPEHLRVMQATDSTFCAKLRESLSRNRRFSWNTRIPKDEFMIDHYAGRVAYNCLKFLDKNRDSISPGTSNQPVVASPFVRFLGHLS